jgi:hypothetical protein
VRLDDVRVSPHIVLRPEEVFDHIDIASIDLRSIDRRAVYRAIPDGGGVVDLDVALCQMDELDAIPINSVSACIVERIGGFLVLPASEPVSKYLRDVGVVVDHE